MMKRNYIIILVLLMVIGFASVATNLVINGTLNLGFNSNSFDTDVIFTYANTAEGKATIEDDEKTITFETELLENVGQESMLTFDVTNKSKQYDAEATITCGLDEGYKSYSQYVDIEKDLSDNFNLDAGETKRGTVTVRMKKAFSESLTKDITFTCNIVASPKERDEEGTYTPDNTYRDEILHGADPVLTSSTMMLSAEETKSKSLIPVTLSDDGKVTRADITKEWYNYENKKWANAIILNDTYDKLNSQGRIHGATKKDGYVSLDGEDDYINLGFENYDFTNGITLSAKVKLLSENTSNVYVMSNIEGAGGSVYISPVQELRVQFYINGDYKYILSNVNLKVGDEYTIVATYDNEFMKLYINGEFIKSTKETGVIKTSSMPYFAGANPNATGKHDGFSNIDVYQTAIYDRAIGEDEIKANFSNDIKITNTDGLLTYANFTNERSVSETILEDDIESYFVWIPKYKYKLFDLGNYESVIDGEPKEASIAKEIEIVFTTEDTKDVNGYSCVTPMNSGETLECDVGEWMTHPAFISMGVNGLWVGKFETGYKGATTKAEAEQTNAESSNIIVKPNVYSWRNNTVSNMFKAALGYNSTLDSHMMKNTEWGAVAYLSHSKYGINTEVNINNNSSFLTGYSAVEGTDQSVFPGTSGTTEDVTLPYNTEIGYKASTTGNITGIYDMSGGAFEYVAAYMPNGTGDKSGFTTEELTKNTKYLDVYLSESTINSYNNRILGDGTGEMGPFYYYADKDNTQRRHNNWYADTSYFVDSTYPWFDRGGDYTRGVLAGQFYFGRSTGGVYSDDGSRLVLAPQ